MLAIRLPEAIAKRLERVARRTGRSKTYYAREAILAYLDEIEDIYLAESRLEDIRAGHTKTISLQTMIKNHGVED